jgi:hypothetical protein
MLGEDGKKWRRGTNDGGHRDVFCKEIGPVSVQKMKTMPEARTDTVTSTT